MSTVPLLSFLFALLAPLAAGQAVGTQLPPVELQGLSQTEAKRFSDFYGRAVLLEFFAHWCAPCAKSVPHLNELHEKFAPRGLSIVGVTSEGPTKTEPWVKKHGLKYAYAYDMQDSLGKLFGVKSIPFSVLVDPFGTIQWSGHPASLTAERVERVLAGALERPVWQWPPAARDLASTLARGDFVAALRAAAAPAPHGETAGDGAGADPVALVQERIDACVANFERTLERSEYRAAFQLAERLKKELAELPEADRIAARVAALQADPEVQRLLTGEERLHELERTAYAARKPAELEPLRPGLETLTRDYAGTRIERRAQALLAEIERALAGTKGKQR